MDEQEKPFDVVSIVLLLFIGVLNDAAEVISDLFAAVIVGLPFEVIMEIIDFLVDGIVLFWFFMKVGFGAPALIMGAGSLAESFGVPARTLTIFFAIRSANHPESVVGKATKAAEAIEGGELNLGNEKEFAEEIAKEAGKPEVSSGGGKEKMGVLGGAQGNLSEEGGVGGGAEGEGEASKGESEVGDQAFGVEPETMEGLQEKYFEESPEEKMEQAEEEAEGSASEDREGQKESDAAKKLREEFEKAQEVARRQKEVAPQQQATAEEGDKRRAA